MKKKVPKGELLFLGVILLYVAYYFWSVRGYAIKAKLWPLCLMAAAVIAVINVALELWRKAPEEKTSEENIPEENVPEGETGFQISELIKKKMPVLVIIVSFAVYALLLKTLGLHLCNFLLVFVMVSYLTKGNWKQAILTAAFMTLGFFLVFDLMLGMRLPKFKLF